MLTRLPVVGMSSSERVSALEASHPRPIRLQTFLPNARKQLNTSNEYTSECHRTHIVRIIKSKCHAPNTWPLVRKETGVRIVTAGWAERGQLR